MKINSIVKLNPVRQNDNKVLKITFKSDVVDFKCANFDRKILEKRRILKKDEKIEDFFENISLKIYGYTDKNLIDCLNLGKISLSTNAYSNVKHPESAKALVLNPNSSTAFNLSKIDTKMRQGLGIGLNFNDFKNPTEEIKKINAYMKYQEPNLIRPPAAIGLLDINHPKIKDFITLKDDVDYKNWCFDLSVIIDDKFLNRVNGGDIAAKEIYSTLLNSMLKKGEPGIIFSSNPNYLCDCCAAAFLKPDETLTLGHINLSKFVQNRKVDYKEIEHSCTILSSAMKKIDTNSYIGILGYQEMLDKLGCEYGSKEALSILENSLKIIQKIAHKNGLKTAIAPTGNICRFLKTTPSIEPKKSDYLKELETMKSAQKYLDGNISKTILLDKTKTVDDIDKIIRYCALNNIKGISVFPVG